MVLSELMCTPPMQQLQICIDLGKGYCFITVLLFLCRIPKELTEFVATTVTGFASCQTQTLNTDSLVCVLLTLNTILSPLSANPHSTYVLIYLVIPSDLSSSYHIHINHFHTAVQVIEG